ncbi:DNA topoisomerase II [Cavenderia fasciculata]|uniref:DNA topoisomerase 2 n=1 Tax=Cavenderia fasciculata TaxID=261658 RepID=F4PXP4_CACFS|nr:DNA topoisomerase II [Cavenderia fasciculata]EGG19554.1 DNA topoisomerase II [Cavenderia fasciculata]|eukprot:XP_004357848.1 DNA topoisomerase II [Cavenderia fasciculata]
MSDSDDDYEPSSSEDQFSDDDYEPSDDGSDYEPTTTKTTTKKGASAAPKKPAAASKKKEAAKPKAASSKKAAATKKSTTKKSGSSDIDDDDDIKPKKPSAPRKKKAAVTSVDSDIDLDSASDSEVEEQPKKKIVSSSGKEKTVEEIYQKKDLLDQILLRPDTYIGSIEKQEEELWIWENDRMKKRKTVFVPGLYKIFDEILVNAADNLQRKDGQPMKSIKVEINANDNRISVWNDGKGVPVEMHKGEKMQVPELVFGHLLTSSNYDDSEERLAGGRNGFGAKLTNAFSQKFLVECADSARKKLFKQTFTKNMKQRDEPVIESYTKATDYTKITFHPDLARFGMTRLDDDDNLELLTKRVYDIAGCNQSLKVYLNGKLIGFNSFTDYIDTYFKDDENAPVVVYERVNPRWEIAVACSDGTPQQVSFVNSICTNKGGTHVTYALTKITEAIIAQVAKKNKGGIEMKPSFVKNHLFIFVNCLIVNPAFDSQTKETCSSKVSTYGSTCIPSDKFLKSVCETKTGIVDQIISWAKHKETVDLKKTTPKATKKGRLNIEKLDEANFAGTKKSEDCTLILTEGDSAKTLATAGISVVGWDHYGVFPLRGKVINVREVSHRSILANEEIRNIFEIMGFQHNVNYDNISTLRYGHLMIMTDQDHDGSHIKGLILNFIHHFWPSLLKIDGFLMEFITPIIKAFKGKNKPISFYTIPEYLKWKETNGGKGYEIKYYKGLGTSKAEEGKEYFADIERHKLDFQWDDNADDSIDMAFNKKRADDRKKWLNDFEPGTYLDQYGAKKIKISEFINKELILFSIADCERSIPSIVDGLKISQRKILYSCFKRNLKKELRVAQLIGYVSEHSAYHHGEASLASTIINMAQDYVGSNNINTLYPSGSFGSRLQGGKDSSQPRYIHTCLRDITRTLFHQDDDNLLTYVNDDGKKVQPKWYMPTIPFVLVNGSSGIGTGYSSSIPNYNPRDLIQCMRDLLDEKEMTDIKPWYRGFRGSIEPKSHQTYLCKGAWKKLSEYELEVTELPIGTWTQSFKELLELLVDPDLKVKRKVEKEQRTAMKASEKGKKIITKGKKPASAASKKKKKSNDSDDDDDVNVGLIPVVKKFQNYSTEAVIHFVITTVKPVDEIDVEKVFKLTTNLNETNMTLFDEHGVLRKYDTTSSIIKIFFTLRLQHYQMRKDYLISKLTEEFSRLSNRARFIQAVITKELVIANVKKIDLIKKLKDMKFDKFTKNATKAAKGKLDSKKSKTEQEEELLGEESDDEGGANKSDAEEEEQDDDTKGYDYLLSMPLWSLTMERAKKILEERDQKKGELDKMVGTPINKIYKNDLKTLEEELDIQDEDDRLLLKKGEALQKVSKGKKPLPKARRRRSSKDSDSDSDGEGGSKKKSTWKPPPRPSSKKAAPVKRKKKDEPSTAATTTTATSNKIDNYFTKVTPSTSTTSTTTTKPSPPQSKMAIDLDSSDESDDESDDVFSVDSSVSAPSKKKAKTAAAPKKPAAAKTTKKAAAKKKKDESSDEEMTFDESDEEEEDILDDDWTPVKKPAATTSRTRATLPKVFVSDDSDDALDSQGSD